MPIDVDNHVEDENAQSCNCEEQMKCVMRQRNAETVTYVVDGVAGGYRRDEPQRDPARQRYPQVISHTRE